MTATFRNRTAVLPVIHHRDAKTSVEQALLARDLGADGAFLISHGHGDRELPEVLATVKSLAPSFPVGLNLLSTPLRESLEIAMACGADMLWADNMGCSSLGLDEDGQFARAFAKRQGAPILFASVAFKHQRHEPDPELAAKVALVAGFVPTTSGPRTGTPPAQSKISSMSRASAGTLAIASGVDPDNSTVFAPFVSHILVATGISVDGDLIDPEKLSLLLKRVRSATSE